MKRRITRVARIMLALSLWTMGYGRWTPLAEAHSQEATVCVKTYTPVVVDGKLDDWVRRVERADWAARLAVKKGDVLQWIRAVPVHLNVLTSRLEAGTVTAKEDLAATVYTMWDDQQFYVAAIVTDNQVVSQHEGADVWQDDAVEFWMDCRHDAVTKTLTQSDEYQLGFSPASQYRTRAIAWAWRNPNTEPVIKTMKVSSSLTPTGYVIEGSVPWKALEGCQPAVGHLIGFNISLVDKDDDQSWKHLTWSGQLHSDPSQFGHLYFVDEPEDLLPSDVFEGPSGNSSLDNAMDATR